MSTTHNNQERDAQAIDRGVRKKVNKYKKSEGKFWEWFQEHASNFGGTEIKPSEEKRQDLESISMDMEGEMPPQRILKTLDDAIRLRDQVNEWYENEDRGTPQSRKSHIEWNNSLKFIRQNLTANLSPNTTNGVSVRRLRRKRSQGKAHPYHHRNCGDNENTSPQRTRRGANSRSAGTGSTSGERQQAQESTEKLEKSVMGDDKKGWGWEWECIGEKEMVEICWPDSQE